MLRWARAAPAAEAQTKANKQLVQSITPSLIQYEPLQRWDGKLPVFNGGATPLVDMTGVLSGTTASGATP